MSRVFVVQEPVARFSRVSGRMEAIDLSDAKKYGDFHYLLRGRDVRVQLPGQPLVVHFKHELANFTDDDYLLAIGDPVAIAMAAAVASQANRGRFKMLKWDRQSQAYLMTQVIL